MYIKPTITTYSAEELSKLVALCASCKDSCYCHSDKPGDYSKQG